MKKKTPLPLFGSRGKTKIIIRGDKDKSKDKSKMKSSGFTMKGNPMKRNFGLPIDNMASPMMDKPDPNAYEKMLQADKDAGKTLTPQQEKILGKYKSRKAKKSPAKQKQFKLKVGEGQGSKRVKGKYTSKTKKLSDLTPEEIKKMKLDKPMGSPAKSRFGGGDGEKTKKVLKTINPVIQGAKLAKNISKATVKGLKRRPKNNPSHVGVRKI